MSIEREAYSINTVSSAYQYHFNIELPDMFLLQLYLSHTSLAGIKESSCLPFCLSIFMSVQSALNDHNESIRSIFKRTLRFVNDAMTVSMYKVTLFCCI